MIDDEEMIENNTDQLIDFKAQLEAFKRRTEQNFPFTLTQVEDAMYIDQYSIMTLEYYYYHNQCKYSYLNAHSEYINETNDLVREDGTLAKHKLGTHLYNQNQDDIHPMSAFERDKVTNYYDSGVDIIKR